INPLLQIDDIYDKIEEEIMATIVTEYLKLIVYKLEARMQDYYFGDLAKHVILNIVRIHAEVYSVSHLLVFDVISRVLDKCISDHLLQHACVSDDLLVIRECFNRYMTDTTITKLNEHISQTSTNINSDCVDRFLKQMHLYLTSFT
ncbi:unnamed protein product, partial [Didymodactylos carnosus]